MIDFFNPTDAPAPGASARFGVPTRAKAAFAGIALGPDTAASPAEARS